VFSPFERGPIKGEREAEEGIETRPSVTALKQHPPQRELNRSFKISPSGKGRKPGIQE
jgi:hypothetical protein